jgi:hypothetical protein
LRAANREKCQPPIDDAELTKYIRRVAQYKDAPHFTRMDTVEAEVLAGALIDMGAGSKTAAAAAKALNPEFDPNGSAPRPSAKKLRAQISKMEAQLVQMKAAESEGPIVELDDGGTEIIDADELIDDDDIEEIE